MSRGIRLRSLLAAFLVSFLGAHAVDLERIRESIRLYDELLAKPADVENSHLIDDMRFKVETLREYREILVGALRRGVGPHGAFDFGSRTVGKWTGGVVPYVFDAGFPEVNRKIVEEGMREWQKVANLNFRPRTSEKDYIQFRFNTNHLNNSYIGRIGGAQEINISEDAGKIICAHELGHALGMVHEQQRTDSTRYVRINWANITRDHQHNFLVVPESIKRGDYDLDSLMHYPRAAFATKPGLLTIEVLPPNEKWSDGIALGAEPKEEIGQTAYLSPLDKAAMAAEYGDPLEIRGRVVDAAGKGVAGVSVKIEGLSSPYRGAENPITSVDDGSFVFSGIPKSSGKYVLNVTLPGTQFVTPTREVEVREEDVVVDTFTSVDAAPPGLAIVLPFPGTYHKTSPDVLGIATDDVGIREIRVALWRRLDGVWWDWKAKTWGGTTFDWASNYQIADGVEVWTNTLPALDVGEYYAHAQSVDVGNNGSAWLSRQFFVDAEPPTVELHHPVPGSRVSGLHSLRGMASDGRGVGILDNKVYFTLSQDGVFWTGIRWKSGTDAQDPEVLLSADVVDGTWIFSALPGVSHSGEMDEMARQGLYAVSLFARDKAKNLSVPIPGKSSVLFTVDWSTPSVSITQPADGTIVTNLPSITGTASDSGGIADVRLYLFSYENGQFWDGTAWGGGGSAILPVRIDAATGTWTSSGRLPSVDASNPSTKLRNGSYNVIAFAVDVAGNETRTDSVFTVEYSRQVIYTAGSYTDEIRDNDNEYWENPANWSTGAPPGPDDTVVIGKGSPFFTGTKTFHGLQLQAGTLNGGRINISPKGLMVWSGGTLNADIVVEKEARCLVTSTAPKVLATQRTLDLQGDSRWSSTSSLHGSGGSLVRNAGTILVEGDVTLVYYNNGVSPQGQFRNEGALSIQGGHLRFNGDYAGWFFTNQTAIKIESGSVVLGNETTHLGGSVSGSGRLMASGRDLVVGTEVLLDGGTVELTQGSLKGVGAFTGTGRFEWTGGTILGDLTVGPETVLMIDGGDHPLGTGARLRNRGRAEWYAGTLLTTGDSRFENSGRLDVLGPVFATYYNNGVTPRGELENTGVLTVGQGQSLTLPADYGGLHYNNNGETRVIGGRLELGGGGVNRDGKYHLEEGLVDWMPTGERFVFKGTQEFSGSGRVRNKGGILITENARFRVLPGATLEQASGEIHGSHAIEGGGTFVWSGGSFREDSEWAADLTTEISGVEPKALIGGRVLNRGKVHWSGTGPLHAQGGSEFRNEGVFEARSHAGFSYYNNGVSPRGQFVNAPSGTIRKIPVSGAPGATTFLSEYGGWLFINQGTLDIQAGSLDLTADDATLESPGRFLGGGAVRIISGRTTVVGTNTVDTGTVELVTGTLISKQGHIRGPGTLAWSGGNVLGTLDLVATNFLIRGPADKILLSGSRIRNSGAGQWSGTGPLRFTGDTFFENLGRFDVQEDTQAMYYNNGVTPRGGFQNRGVFTKSGGTNAMVLYADYGGPIFDNSGTVLVQSGRMELSGGGDWVGGVIDVKEQVAALDFRFGSYRFSGTHVLGGSTRWRGAEIVLESAILEVKPTATVELLSGVVRGLGYFQDAGTFRWVSGTVSADVSLSPKSKWLLQGLEEKSLVGGTIRNEGVATWIDAGFLKAQGKSLLHNSGRFVMVGDGHFTYYDDGVGPKGRFHNTGVLEKQGSTGQSRFEPDYGGWDFTSTGTIDIQTGTLSLGASASMTNSTIRGAGRVRVAAGPLSCSGNIVLDGGTLELAEGRIEGTATYSGAGQLLWTSGEVRGSHTIASGGRWVLQRSGSQVLASGATLENRGTVTWKSGGGVLNGSGQSRFLNRGVLEVDGVAVVAYYDNGVSPVGLFENTGTVRLGSEKALLRFPGDYGGWRVSNAGLLDLGPGRIEMAPKVDLSAESVIRIQLDRNPPAGAAPPMRFTSSATLRGALELSWREGMASVSTESRSLLGHPGRSGEFSRVDLPDGDGGDWVMSFGSDLTRLVFQPKVVFENQIAPVGNDGALQIGVRGPPSQAAILQGSVNLVDWTNIATNRPFTGQFQFSQPIGGLDGRFFRTVFVE
ncbi:MAG: M12 family metallopeptidase [Limisphaerales bacterium]